MTNAVTNPGGCTVTTRAEAIANAGRVYAAILADPERRAALLAHRAATPAPAAPTEGDGDDELRTEPRRG